MQRVTEVSNVPVQIEKQPYDAREIKRGEVYYINLEDIGYNTKHIISKSRPAVIIQNDIGNQRGNTLIVAFLTTTFKRDYPFQYKLQLNGKDSIIMFEQIMTIDRERVESKMGELTHSQMLEADKRLMYSLQLDRLLIENILDFDVISVINKKTKTKEECYFEILILFEYNQSKVINVSLTKLKEYDSIINKDIGLDQLKQLLDCCKGLHWLFKNNEV